VRSGHYTTTAKALHWLMALMIPCMLARGLHMEGLPVGRKQARWQNPHKQRMELCRTRGLEVA